MEVIRIRKRQEMPEDIAERTVQGIVEQTGCLLESQGNVWKLSMERDDSFPQRQGIRDAIVDTGCFDILDEEEDLDEEEAPVLAE